ncbi:MAG: hypothetical protein HOV79_23945 [Hamadaea sp.]|nr:hypothetical protein [Hamadaea sp.]
MQAGKHRRMPLVRIGGLIALLVALAAAGRLLTLPPPHPPGTDWTLAEAYPDARIVDVPGYVDGDWAYQPMIFLDARTSVGTATPAAGGAIKLVIADAGGATRTLRTLTETDAPQFGGLAVGADRIVWLEQTAGPDGQGLAQIWAAGRDGADPRALTSDVGEFAFFNSQYDLIIRDGRVHWIAAAPTESPRTEIRSVALTGGSVDVRTLDGGWQFVGGDWLATAMTSGGGATAMVNWKTGKRSDVPNQPSELVSCSATLCRVLVLGGDGGATRIDVMQPDGRDRHTAVAGAVTASLVDVGLLDRWEVYSRAGRGTSALSSQQVLLYDVEEQRMIALADGAGQILGRDGYAWWSTGTGDYVAWHALELRTLN